MIEVEIADGLIQWLMLTVWFFAMNVDGGRGFFVGFCS